MGRHLWPFVLIKNLLAIGKSSRSAVHHHCLDYGIIARPSSNWLCWLCVPGTATPAIFHDVLFAFTMINRARNHPIAATLWAMGHRLMRFWRRRVGFPAIRWHG